MKSLTALVYNMFIRVT